MKRNLCSLFSSVLYVFDIYSFSEILFIEEFLRVAAELTLGGLGSFTASEVSIPLSPSSA